MPWRRPLGSVILPASLDGVRVEHYLPGLDGQYRQGLLGWAALYKPGLW